MLSTDEDAVLCDMAETYHIYDLESLPVSTVATLACGLRENSRIMMRLSGQRVALEPLLLARAVDSLSLLVWAKTEDGRKGRNPPESVTKLLTETKTEPKKQEIKSYDSPEDFMAARARTLKAVN